jgi:drug/metabolite transporter (DMT)-like permease
MTGSLLAAIGLSLLSAIAYALAAVVQERLAATSGAVGTTSSLLTSGRGWWAICLNSGGALLHAVALAYASLTVVQPLGALGLVMALPVGAALAGRRVRAREWRGAVATVAGLIGVLLAANTGTPGRALTDGQTLLLLAITAAVLWALGKPRPVGQFPGLLLALAGGAAFAVASVLTQTVLLRLSDGGAEALYDPVLGITVVALGALSVGGLLLSQAAYKHGLGAQLAALTIVNPVVAAAVGIGLLGQGAGLSGPDIGTALFAAAVAAVGVVLLATPEGGRVERTAGDRPVRRRRSARRRSARRRSAVALCAAAVHPRWHPSAGSPSSSAPAIPAQASSPAGAAPSPAPVTVSSAAPAAAAVLADADLADAHAMRVYPPLLPW